MLSSYISSLTTHICHHYGEDEIWTISCNLNGGIALFVFLVRTECGARHGRHVVTDQSMVHHSMKNSTLDILVISNERHVHLDMDRTFEL
jgi:hypothetical protein